MNEKRSLFIMVVFENSLESFFLEKIEFENLEMKYPIEIQKSKNPESYHYVEQFIIFNNTFVSLKTILCRPLQRNFKRRTPENDYMF